MAMSFGDRAKQVLATVAPLLGTALGGPLGTMAGTLLANALGTPAGDPKAAEAALLSANPDALLKLKQAEMDFQARMEELGISEEKLAYDDTANAREREVSVKDFTPRILAYLVTVGFFGILGFLLWSGKPQSGGDVLMVMLGALGSAWTGIIQYFYGSSAGSAAKTDTINKIIAPK